MNYLAITLLWFSISVIAIAIGGLLLAWWFDGTPSQIAARQAQAIPEQITKEFNRRPRMRVVRFFNALSD